MTDLMDKMNDEITAMALHGTERGLTANDLSMVAAVLIGVLVREFGASEADKRESLASCYRVMAAQAGLADGKTN